LLKSLPASLGRTRQELELQIALGAPLMAKGYGAAEVGVAYDRALELCREIGETPELFPVLFGVCVSYLARADFKKARELAEQLLNLAERVGDPALLLEAHLALGGACFWLGQPTVARAHYAQGIGLYDAELHRSHAFIYGQDPGVGCLSFVG